MERKEGEITLAKKQSRLHKRDSPAKNELSHN